MCESCKIVGTIILVALLVQLSHVLHQKMLHKGRITIDHFRPVLTKKPHPHCPIIGTKRYHRYDHLPSSIAFILYFGEPAQILCLCSITNFVTLVTSEMKGTQNL